MFYHYAGNNPVKYTDPDGNETAVYNNRQGDYDLLPKFQGIDTGNNWYNNLLDGFVSSCLEGTYNLVASCVNLLTNGLGYGVEAFEGLIDWADVWWPSYLTLTGGVRSDYDAFCFICATKPQLIAEGLACLSETSRYLSAVAKAKTGPYAHLVDPPSVGPGKPFTPAQKKAIIEENMKRNGGVVRSDGDGRLLVPSTKRMKGVTSSPDEWQIDHIYPRSLGGSNSMGNAQVLSLQENVMKSNKVK